MCELLNTEPGTQAMLSVNYYHHSDHLDNENNSLDIPAKRFSA